MYSVQVTICLLHLVSFMLCLLPVPFLMSVKLQTVKGKLNIFIKSSYELEIMRTCAFFEDTEHNDAVFFATIYSFLWLD